MHTSLKTVLKCISMQNVIKICLAFLLIVDGRTDGRRTHTMNKFSSKPRHRFAYHSLDNVKIHVHNYTKLEQNNPSGSRVMGIFTN